MEYRRLPHGNEKFGVLGFGMGALRQTFGKSENGNSVIYYFKDATAVISAFSHAPEIIKF